MPPRTSPAKSNTSTVGTKHFFVMVGYLESSPDRFLFLWGDVFGVILGDALSNVFNFVAFPVSGY